MRDTVLGKLSYDQKMERWNVPLPREYKNARCSIYTEPASLQQLLVPMREIISNIEVSVENAKSIACDALLKTKNQSWIDENEEEVTSDEFMENLELSSLNMEQDGSLTFYFRDGDMFWGHYVEVSIQENGAYTNANLVG